MPKQKSISAEVREFVNSGWLRQTLQYANPAPSDEAIEMIVYAVSRYVKA